MYDLRKSSFLKFILADEPFAKALRIFETFVSANNSLYRELVSSIEFPIKFDEKLRVASVLFFIPDFSLLNCELDSFAFKDRLEASNDFK